MAIQQPSPDLVKCPQCGENNMTSNDFCWKCRYNLSGKQPSSRTASCWVIGGIILAVLLAIPVFIIVLGLIFMKGGTP